MNLRQSDRGFTLIELMVVVAILGLLTRLAAPHYQASVEKARLSEVVMQIDTVRGVASSSYQAGSERRRTLLSGTSLNPDSNGELNVSARQAGFSSALDYPGLNFSTLTSTRQMGHFPAGVNRLWLVIVGSSPEGKQSLGYLSETLPASVQAWGIRGFVLQVMLLEDI